MIFGAKQANLHEELHACLQTEQPISKWPLSAQKSSRELPLNKFAAAALRVRVLSGQRISSYSLPGVITGGA